MLLQRIQQQFIDSADLKYQCAQSLAPAVESAVAAVLASLTGGGKVLSAGNGLSAAMAAQLATALVSRFERDRPELAGWCLSTDATLLTGVAADQAGRAVFARQVRALGHAGDVLVLLSVDGQSGNLLAAVEAAHEREMTVVALTGQRGGALARLLKDTDVHICVPSDELARILEIHQIALHALCDGVDVQLLGLPEPPLTETENLA